jgi:hypothetical protein
MEEIQIFEQLLIVDEKIVGKMAILVGGLGKPNPKEFMDIAVSNYVKDFGHNQYIEIHLDNPWTRLITTGINQLPLRPLTPQDSLGLNS